MVGEEAQGFAHREPEDTVDRLLFVDHFEDLGAKTGRAALLQDRDGLIPRHRGRVIEELVEREPRFKVADEGVGGDTGTPEYRHSADDLGIDRDR